MIHVSLTSGRLCPWLPGVRTLPLTGNSVEQSLVDAAAPAGDPGPEHGQAPEEAVAGLTANALKERAAVMFSGTAGGPVASGEAGAAKDPSLGLIRDAFMAIEALPSVLFDKHAQHRPCGLLDQYEAVGMLIGDVLGMPLIPAGELARAVGFKAFKMNGKIATEVGKAKKAAARKGADPTRAEADVLGTAVHLPLPSAAECAAARARGRARKHPRPASAAPPPPEPAPPPSPSPPPGLDEWGTKRWLEDRQRAKQKLAAWSNDACTCRDAANGHAFWCQVYKCYAFEIGCCDPTPFWKGRPGLFNLPCECIREAFEPRHEEYRYGRYPGTWEGRVKGLGSSSGGTGDLVRIEGRLVCVCCNRPKMLCYWQPTRFGKTPNALRGDLYLEPGWQEVTDGGPNGHFIDSDSE